MAAKREVTCPKCGKPGVEAVDKFTAKGHVYYYRVVRHGAKRCIIERVEEPTAGPKPEVAKAGPKQAAKVEAVEVVEAAPPAVVPPFAKPAVVKVKEGEVKFGRYFYEPIGPSYVSRSAWYAFQVAASWGSFRENPSEENFQFFARNVEKIAGRFKGEVEEWAKIAVEAARKYMEEPTHERRGAVNEAVHNFITAVIKAAVEEHAREEVKPIVSEFAEAVRAVIEGAMREAAKAAAEEAVKAAAFQIDEETKRAIIQVFIRKKGYTPEQAARAREFIKKVIGA